MRPRFVGRLGAADVITVANGMLGFVAAAVAAADPALAARLVLLAAMGDGLDGIVARRTGGTPVGTYLDSLADVAAFGVAPGLAVVALVRQGWDLGIAPPGPRLALAVALPAAFAGMVVVRLAFYTANDADVDRTEGVPSTLASTLLSAAVLTGGISPPILLAGTAALSYLMIAEITYPDLLPRDTFLMGVVHGLAVVFPGAFGRAFPYALVTLATAYLVLAPRFYWGPDERT